MKLLLFLFSVVIVSAESDITHRGIYQDSYEVFGREYVYVNKKLTFQEASEYCENLEHEDFPYGRLIMTDFHGFNYVGVELLNLQVRDNPEQYFWTGYTKNFLEDEYSPYGATLYGNRHGVHWSLWDENEPKTTGLSDEENVNCVISAGHSGTYYHEGLQTRSCEDKFNFVCERDINPGPKIRYREYNGDKQFAIMQGRVTAKEAEHWCENLAYDRFPNGRLTTPDSADSKIVEEKLLSYVGAINYWTGYRKLESETEFNDESYGGVVEGGKETMPAYMFGNNEPKPTGAEETGINCLTGAIRECYVGPHGYLQCYGPLSARNCNEMWHFVCERDTLERTLPIPDVASTKDDQMLSNMFLGIFVVGLLLGAALFGYNTFKSTRVSSLDNETEPTHYVL